MNESLFSQFRITVLEKRLTVYGINVYQRGRGEISCRWRSDNSVAMFSGSKTFTSVGIGIAQDEGRLKLSDRVQDFFPEYRGIASEGSDKITIRDLLHMASGKSDLKDIILDEVKLNGRDGAEVFFADAMKCDAGTQFYYTFASSYMLSRIIEKTSGLLLRDYLVPRLFNPLDIYNPQWFTCPGGHTLGAAGLYLKTEEFLRLGVLLLNDGIYNNKQIVSREYLHNAITDIINTGNTYIEHEYGYQLWKASHKGAYFANGMYGQFCFVIPDKEAVIAVTAHEENNQKSIQQAVFKDIVPYLD